MVFPQTNTPHLKWGLIRNNMEEIVFDSKWIKVKQTPRGHFFSERRGTNSIALLLYRKIKENGFEWLEVLVRLQALPIDNAQSNDDKEIPKLFRCPITGRLDDSVGERINQVRAEAREEGGYDIPEAGFQYIGEYYVGTQTNEKVFMYVADTTIEGTEIIEAKGDGSYFEEISKNEWVSVQQLLDTEYSGLNILANKLDRMFQCGVI